MLSNACSLFSLMFWEVQLEHVSHKLIHRHPPVNILAIELLKRPIHPGGVLRVVCLSQNRHSFLVLRLGDVPLTLCVVVTEQPDGELRNGELLVRHSEDVGGALPPLKHLSLIHISEPTRLLSISYAVFCLKKKKKNICK
eukprot:TRINITY_DN20414_c0_g1_i2.p1 TRINITY_DN20414_c0_g1~~TRINITY_DN20414_c0_g1_i2.p1  ORF type:complete len:140 (+),score=23.76 TRINITY_DN20414_c0_g1_i2:208-627(+)